MTRDYKFLIINALKAKVEFYSKTKEEWKVKAYKTVQKQINELPNIFSESDLDKISGIGKSIKTVICDVFKQQYTSPEIKPVDIAIENLTKVHGIGEKKAIQLFEEHGIQTIEDLKKNTHLLNKKQIIGLSYEQDFSTRINRNEIDKHKEIVTSVIHDIDSTLMVEFVGSYRRGAKDSKDIDILICHPKNKTDKLLETIVEKLKQEGYIKDILAIGDKKFFGVAKVKYGRHYRRIDIMITPKEEFPFAVLYFTGSKEFNIDLRNYCLKLGMSLNEYGLTYKQDKTPFPKTFTTEEEVFKCLGLQYIPPEERRGNILQKFKVQS